MTIFDTLESAVRSYSRLFPALFDRASGSRLYDEAGREYIDFFSGAGSVNYGHNNPVFKELLVDYLRRDGITHALDMSTTAKKEFLTRFSRLILEPRGLRYKVQFTGPTGTNAVEAALKLARKVTGRSHVFYFYNAYHGMTLGALAVTGSAAKRGGAGVPLPHTTPVPFEGDLGSADTIEFLRALLGWSMNQKRSWPKEGSSGPWRSASEVRVIGGAGGSPRPWRSASSRLSARPATVGF
jgi:diaminobutyrate-2-oxoglutarate transaminase